MTKIESQSALFPDCPIRNVLSRIGDKWSMLVLYTLEQHGVLRFNGLKLYIPDISKKMLSAALKVLEADGLISRKVYAEIPPKVEYTLTERGQTLIPLINNLIEWASANITDIVEDRKNFLIHNSKFIIGLMSILNTKKDIQPNYEF